MTTLERGHGERAMLLRLWHGEAVPRVSPLLVAFALAGGCSRPPARPAATPPPEVVMERVTLVHTQGAQATVRASSPRVELSRSTSMLLAADAGIHLLARDVFVEAGHLEGSVDQGHLEGTDGVRLRTAQGTTGASPRVSFDRSAGPQGGAASDAGVRLTGDGFVLDAQGFSADFADERVVFDRPVTRVDRALKAESGERTQGANRSP